jgi:hypothetical protein
MSPLSPSPTSFCSSSELLADQKRWEQTPTARHWSGFFNNLAAAKAHCVRNGSWFSSPKHVIFSNVPIIKVIAASWARESLTSSSYREKACNKVIVRLLNLVKSRGLEQHSPPPPPLFLLVGLSVNKHSFRILLGNFEWVWEPLLLPDSWIHTRQSRR